MNSYNVEIVTPIRKAKFESVGYLRCPGLDGSFGVMKKHRAGVFALSVGEIKITQNGKDEYFATGGGERLAEELVLPFLGKIPLDADIVAQSDKGVPVVMSRPDSVASKAFLELADNCHKFLNPEEVKAG